MNAAAQSKLSVLRRRYSMEYEMKHWFAPVALVSLLNGCTTTLDLKGSDAPQVSGVLSVDWIEPHAIVIQHDGMRYSGDWSSRVCTTDACRGVFRNVLKIHRRHIHQGRAVLAAKNGSSLVCEWVSHLPELDGTCRAQDGSLFKLKSGKAVASTMTSGVGADSAMP